MKRSIFIFSFLCLHSQLVSGQDLNQDWLRKQNHDFNQIFDKSPNKQKISKALYLSAPTDRLMFEKTLKSGKTLSVIDRGLGHATEVVLTDGQVAQVIFSNLDLKRNQSFRFRGFQLSPDQKWLAINLILNGSTDKGFVLVIDSQTGATRGKLLTTKSSDFMWQGNDRILTESPTQDETLVIYSIDSGEVTKNLLGGMTTAVDGASLLSGFGDCPILRTSGEGDYTFDCPENTSLDLLGRNEDRLYFRSRGSRNQVPRLFVGQVQPNQKIALSEINYELQKSATEDTVVDEVSLGDSFFVLSTHRGLTESLQILDLKGQTLANHELSDEVSLLKIPTTSKNGIIELTFQSPVVKSHSIRFDLKQKAWIDENPSQISLLQDPNSGLELTHEILQVKSEDGTLVPVRLFYRKGLLKDGRNPVWIRSYGGFNLSGYTTPTYNPTMIEFLKRGGISAAPALRGGNEFGAKWHEAAMKENKIKTMQDLIATARGLVAQGYTQSNLIISEGTSNGGFVVASAGLLAPDAFGLVIPINGVLNFFKKEVYDSEMYEGWSYEYGDSRKDEMKESMLKISPVELAKVVKNPPRFLVLNGTMDTRVNPLHSKDFIEALNQKASYSGIKNSGHWMMAMKYQNLIGWRGQTVILTTVFDHLGWTF